MQAFELRQICHLLKPHRLGVIDRTSATDDDGGSPREPRRPSLVTVVAALLRPGASPRPTTGVDAIETHRTWEL
jgi:hypothetical protein